ncbi:MAG: hypothetical protein ACJ8BW_24055 [Ktedonobacteraceae bacterium]
MNLTRLLRIIATIAAVVAVTFGMGTYTHADFTSIHMLFGLLVALILLILALLAVFTNGLRRLGAISVVYALIMPIFGVTQQMILAGELHWLIQTAHLVVGFGAIALIERISAGFARRRQTIGKSVVTPAEVSQGAR